MNDVSHLRDVFFTPVEVAFDHFFDEFWGAPKVLSHVKSNMHYPKMDIGMQGDEFVITSAVPGVDPAELKVEIVDGIVKISGEMSEEFRSDDSGLVVKELCKRKFSREVSLPETNDLDPQATLKNGILTLRWKCKGKEKPPKKLISIKSE